MSGANYFKLSIMIHQLYIILKDNVSVSVSSVPKLIDKVSCVLFSLRDTNCMNILFYLFKQMMGKSQSIWSNAQSELTRNGGMLVSENGNVGSVFKTFLSLFSGKINCLCYLHVSLLKFPNLTTHYCLALNSTKCEFSFVS